MSWIKNNEWLAPDGDHRVRWRELRRFAVHYGPFRGLLATAGAFALLGSATAFLIPYVFYRLQVGILERSSTVLGLALLAYLGISLLETGTGYGIRVIRTRISTRLNRGLVLQYYGKLLNVAVEDFIAFRQRTNLFQRVIDAMSITPQFTDVLVRGGQATIMLLVVGTVIGMLSIEVLGVLAVGALLLFAYNLLRSRELRELRQRTLGLNYPLVGKMTEVINGLFTIKALSASLRVTRDVAGLVGGKTEAEYNEQRAEAGMLHASGAIRQVALVFAMGEGTILFMGGQVTFAELISLYILANLFLQPVAELAQLYQSLSRLSVNVAGFFEVVDLPDEAAQAHAAAGARQRAAALRAAGAGVPVVVGSGNRSRNVIGNGIGIENGSGSGAHGTGIGMIVLTEMAVATAAPEPREGHIVFDRVEFGYRGGPPVITGIDLEILPGEKVSLIGRSGVGKTTLLRLLLGFLHPQRGTILLDGRDIAVLADKNAYRRQFGVVSQNDVLFAVSIRENLAFGLDASVPEARMQEALRMVGLWEKVARLRAGLDTDYSDDLFSGGEKQRFFIARALLRQPSVVLLDEPTSALDFQSEGQVIDAIDQLVGGKTTITIAHRLSTVRSADRVVVLDGGTVRGMGPHDELYRSNDYYRALCDYNSFVV